MIPAQAVALPKISAMCQLETWIGGPAAQVRCGKADIGIGNPQ